MSLDSCMKSRVDKKRQICLSASQEPTRTRLPRQQSGDYYSRNQPTRIAFCADSNIAPGMS